MANNLNTQIIKQMGIFSEQEPLIQTYKVKSYIKYKVILRQWFPIRLKMAQI